MQDYSENANGDVPLILKCVIFLVSLSSRCAHVLYKEGVSVTIGNPAFCLGLYLTGVHFRGELQHIGDVVSKNSSLDQSELKK